MITEKTRQKMRIARLGKSPWNKGRPWTDEERMKLSEAHIGIKMPPRTAEHRMNMANARRGEKSHLWRGGVSEENKRIRAGVEFRLWREAVFSRDNWTCQWCSERGGELHPHHLKRFSDYPELRFAIDNGITLCAKCHRETDSFGRCKK